MGSGGLVTLLNLFPLISLLHVSKNALVCLLYASSAFLMHLKKFSESPFAAAVANPFIRMPYAIKRMCTSLAISVTISPMTCKPMG